MKGGMKKAFTALLAATVLVGGMPVNMQANVIAETEKAESASEKVNEKYADTEELDLMDRERQETQAGEQDGQHHRPHDPPDRCGCCRHGCPVLHCCKGPEDVLPALFCHCTDRSVRLPAQRRHHGGYLHRSGQDSRGEGVPDEQDVPAHDRRRLHHGHDHVRDHRRCLRRDAVK